MQSPDPLTLSRDGMFRLRLDLRGPLHQIISYSDIMNEEAAEEGHNELCKSFFCIVSAAQSALEIINTVGSREGELGLFLDRWREGLQPLCATILELTGQLQATTTERKFASLQSDLSKLYAAAQTFEQAVNAFGVNSCVPVLPTDRSTNSEVASASPVPISSFGSLAKSPMTSKRAVILVVDDNEGNRDVLSRRLLRDGCEVLLAESGSQALKMVRRYDFDVVLLDIMMPEMDGYAVLAELKKDPRSRHLPVMMISAVDEIESVVRCIEMGADDYLFKPFNPVLLRARIGAFLERKRLRDEERKKTAELEKAFLEIQRQRKRTEELLLNILPPSVAEELQVHGSVQPMYFEDVSIVFADFAGFTRSTEQLPAEDLVHVLNDYFTAFDKITVRYGLEKLKTIGDCYMYVGGLPARSPSHPVDTVLVAFEMLHVVAEMGTTGPVDWQLRIGVHTGPVVAGVVGIHKFSFDIWGEAVNFSSRMESSGAPGRINLSATAHARVKDFFSCEKRGKIAIKHGCDVDMYFVNHIAPGLLAKGSSPRQGFEQRYRTYFHKDLRSFPDFLVEQQGPVSAARF